MNITALNQEIDRLTEKKNNMVPPYYLDELYLVEQVLLACRKLTKRITERLNDSSKSQFDTVELSYLSPPNADIYEQVYVDNKNAADVIMQRVLESTSYAAKVLGNQYSEYINILLKIDSLKEDISKQGIKDAKNIYNFR